MERNAKTPRWLDRVEQMAVVLEIAEGQPIVD